MNQYYETKDLFEAVTLYYFSPQDYLGYKLGEYNGRKHVLFVFDHAGSQEDTLTRLGREHRDMNINWYYFKAAQDFMKKQIRFAKKEYNLF